MNKYTVRKTTQGLANYIINYLDDGSEKGVVIAYDTRHKSEEFAREAALVLAANEINCYLFSEISPVPLLSFAVRELNTACGIVITASHNPAEYNGYKVYGEDGGQVIPELARKITAEIEEIEDFSFVKIMEKKEALAKGRLKMVGQALIDRFLDEIMSVIPDKKLAADRGDQLKIMYTPLHGTGNKPVTQILKRLGFEVMKVEEQSQPDPDFSTVEAPNPENISSFEIALKQAEEKKPDLIFGTDPDCDRLGVVLRDTDGEYQALNGNETGVLLADFLLNRIDIPEKGVIIKTIVTTDLVKEIADSHGVEVIDVLTGFKYIGEKIKKFEEEKSKQFIFGFEESYGYLAGTYSRDKDAVVAAALFAVMALYYQENDSSVLKHLENLRREYGFYQEELESIILEGKEGQEKITEILTELRQEKKQELNNTEVICFKDYRESLSYDYVNDCQSEIDLPSSNVLQYFLADDSKLTIRPSGTEPKLKIYFSVKAENDKQAGRKMETLKDNCLNEIKERLAKI